MNPNPNFVGWAFEEPQISAKRISLTGRCWPQLLLGLLLILPGSDTTADPQLTIITLKHRPATQLLPLLKPLIRQGDYLAAENDKLLVRTDPNTLQAVRQIVSELDRSPITLLITVKQGGQLGDEINQVKGELSVKHGNFTAQTGGSAARIMARVEHPQNEITRSISATNQRTQERGHSEQQVKVGEGYEAHFFISQQIPTVSYQQGYYGQLHPAVSYRSAVTGFTVLGQITGEQVRLQIRSRKEKFSGRDDIRGQQIDTSLVTNLGEWTQIGGTTLGESRSQQGMLARTDLRQNQHQSILIKVDIVDESN